jgi:hypothetical protein
MPRTIQSASQASSSRAQSSHPTIEQREILFETEFNVNGDFKNFEATQWAIQEFKRRGLKKLFKPVTSTAYTKLVVQFYSNLSRDCSKPGTLSSIVKGKQLDVTTSDIAARCIATMSTHRLMHNLMTSQILSMSPRLLKTCVPANMPMRSGMQEAGPNCHNHSYLWIMFCTEMSAHWGTSHRGVTNSYKHYTPSTRATGIQSHPLYGIKFKNFGMVRLHARPVTQSHGGFHFHSCSLTFSRRKASRALPKMDRYQNTRSSVRNQWNHSQSHMPREVRVEIPAEEGGEEAEHMEEDAPAPQQGGRADTVVISRTEYELLSGAHQRLEKLEECFITIETQSATNTKLLREILGRLPQQKGHHLPSHLRSSSELLHRLAEDVKLSAHGRHPTVYPFTFVVLVFPVIFLFILVSCITFGFSFQRQNVSSVQVWGCAMSHASPTSSLNFHSR